MFQTGRHLLTAFTLVAGIAAPQATSVSRSGPSGAGLGALIERLGPGAARTHGPVDPFDPLDVTFPKPHLKGRRPLSVWATHYSVPRVLEASPLAEDAVPLLYIDGRPLGPKLSRRDLCTAAVSGTIEVIRRNGSRRLYAYLGLASDATDGASDVRGDDEGCAELYPNHPGLLRARFRPIRAARGNLASDANLVPFRSIAVDPTLVPLGSTVYIPAARGTVVKLPDGRTRIHDGYFYAVDTGGSVSDGHVDIFLGTGQANPFIFVKSDPKARVEAYIIDDPELDDELAAAHGTVSLRPR